jgi:hypothetical protein
MNISRNRLNVPRNGGSFLGAKMLPGIILGFLGASDLFLGTPELFLGAYLLLGKAPPFLGTLKRFLGPQTKVK